MPVILNLYVISSHWIHVYAANRHMELGLIIFMSFNIEIMYGIGSMMS